MTQKALICIGANKEAVKEARAAIVEILRVNVSDTVKCEALETLRTICGVTNTAISNCNFEGRL
jgi:hypothetical protein